MYTALLILTAVLLSTSVSSAHRCDDLFRSTLLNPSTTPQKPRPTVKIIGIERTEAGEEFFRIRRLLEESSWVSNYSPRGFDPQGSPQFIFSVLGFELARVLGFGWNSKNEILAPVPNTLNARIETFNTFLGKKNITPISIRFYIQAHPTIKSFFEGWSENNQIPVASGLTSHTVHDIVFHYSNILLPDPIVRLISTDAAIAREWRMFHLGPLTRIQAFQTASMIDSFSTSANVGEGRQTTSREIEEFLRTYLGRHQKNRNGRTARRVSAIENLSPLSVFVKKQRWANGLSREPDDFIIAASKEFYQKMKAEHPEWDRPFSEYELGDLDTIAVRYNQRAAELRQAAREYLRQ